MENWTHTVASGVLTTAILVACKNAYEPPVQTHNIRLLVVEGFINSGQGATIIHLSRTGDLQDTSTKPELGAKVQIEGEDGSAFLLTDNRNGDYSIPQLTLNNNA